MKTWHKLLAAALLAAGLTACGGGDSSGSGDNGNLAQAAVSRSGELTAFVQQRLRALSAQGQLGGMAGAAGGDAVPAGPTASVAGAPARSSTLVQEAGVDEADLMLSDGSTIYTVQPAAGAGPTLASWQRGSDGRVTRLGSWSLPLDGAAVADTDGMHLSDGHRSLAVISRSWVRGPYPPGCADLCPTLAPVWMASTVNVQRVDVGNPAQAVPGERIQIDGSLVDSRRIGNQLYVVTRWQPVLSAQVMPASATAAEREAAIAALKPSDLLPRMRRNGGPSEPLLNETDCYVRGDIASNTVQLTAVTVFDLSSPQLTRSSRCFVGGTEALYMSATHLYLATSRWLVPASVSSFAYPTEMRTDLHKFALGGGTVTYRGSGEVPGHLGWDREKMPLRLSEHNGDLRVLSFTGSFGWFTLGDADTTAASPATLTILRERSSDQTLQPVGSLPNRARPAAIGKPGEQVYGVRFLGDRAYVVTFRRTDPLYVLDLTNPADPLVAGSLEVAGFSDYLYPMPGGQLLGVGRDADSTGRPTGLKFALFDVQDPAHPSQRASLTVGQAGSFSALESSRHGLNFLQVGTVARVAVPAVVAGSAYADYRHGLLKVEVDSSAGTLRPMGLAGADNVPYAPLWLERSLQIGDQLYYLTGGTVIGGAW